MEEWPEYLIREDGDTGISGYIENLSQEILGKSVAGGIVRIALLY